MMREVYWNILHPAALRDHQSSFKASIHSMAGYSTYIYMTLQPALIKKKNHNKPPLLAAD